MYTDIFDESWNEEMCAATIKSDQYLIRSRDSQRTEAFWDIEMSESSNRTNKNLIEANTEPDSHLLDQVPMDRAEMDHVPVDHITGALTLVTESKVN
jgi:hypothetical protein